MSHLKLCFRKPQFWVEWSRVKHMKCSYTRRLASAWIISLLRQFECLNVHHISQETKAVMTIVKQDLMTAENGFIANEKTFLQEQLMKQHSWNDIEKNLHFINQLCACDGVNIIFPVMSHDRLHNMYEKDNGGNYISDDDDDEEVDVNKI